VWDKPSRLVHPEIHHTKALIQYMCDVLKMPPFVFVDLHGHSRRANVFMFGNNPEESWRADDKVVPHNYEFMALPEVLEQVCARYRFISIICFFSWDFSFSSRSTPWCAVQ
ncbi:hypothetical protein GCK32_007347, partial [Trichostrongylus colubriformis]